MDDKMRLFLQDESGATVVEYAILAGLLSIAAIVIIGAVGARLEQMYGEVNQKMTDAGM